MLAPLSLVSNYAALGCIFTAIPLVSIFLPANGVDDNAHLIQGLLCAPEEGKSVTVD